MTETRDITVPNLLFIDCESSGLIRNDLPLTDPAQPWPMQVAAMLCNSTGAIANHFSFIVKSDGRTAKDKAVQVHGISPWVTSQIGVPEPRVLGVLADLLKTIPMTAMKVISFGDFDQRLISSAFARFSESQGRTGGYYKLWEGRRGTEFIDLQKPWCTQICKLKGTIDDLAEYKWPTLDEAAKIILGRAPRDGQHDAYQDLLILRDLYLAIAERGMFGHREAA